MLLGIDIGTTSLKLSLFDINGNLIDSSSAELEVSFKSTSQIEVKQEKIWRLFLKLIKEISFNNFNENIEAIGITGTYQINFWDKENRLVRPSILYGDERLPSSEVYHFIIDNIDAKMIGRVFGLDSPNSEQIRFILRSLPISKLLWLKDNEPIILSKINSITVTGQGYLASKLIELPVNDLVFSEFNKKIGDLFNLEIPVHGSPIQPGSIVGYISDSTAEITGLPVGIPVILCGIDSHMSLIGGGITKKGSLLNQTGTTDVIALCVDGEPHPSCGYKLKYYFDNLWVISLSPFRAGVVNWGTKMLFSDVNNKTISRLHEIASTSTPGAGGLLFLPYVQGEQGVIHDTSAKGILAGISPQQTRADFARALLEGLAFSLREVIEAYEYDGFTVDSIRLAGAGSISKVLNSIKADIIKKPVSVLEVVQTGCLGAAMTAAVSLGLYEDLKEASNAMSRVKYVVEPDLLKADHYDELFNFYKELYPRNKNLFLDFPTWPQPYFNSDR